MKQYTLILFAVCLLVGAATACGGDDEPSDASGGATTTGDTTAPGSLGLELVDATIVQGGELQLFLSEALTGTAELTLEGDLDGAPWSHTWTVTLAAEAPRVRLPWAEQEAAGVTPGASFDGALRLVGETAQGSLMEVTLQWVEVPAPSVSPPTDEIAVHLGERTAMPADGLLRASEGGTSALLWGEFDEDSGVTRPVHARVALEVGSSRGEAVVRWPAEALGLREGVCRCELIPRNDALVGGPVVGDPVAVQVRLKRSVVDALDPPAFSRGQVIRVLGRGLIQPDPSLGQSIFFDLEGELTTEDGSVVALTGEDVFRIAPEEVVTSNEALVVIRSETVELDDGRTVLSGVSALSGVFEGTVTPVLVLGTDTARGAPFEGRLELLPPRQVVYVNFLPNFVDALGRFGLAASEAAIRARVFEVLRRDYDGIHISFVEERPEDVVEYSVIEVGGPDPNGIGLLGLDNTEGKDTGNVRLNDIIGGYNAETREQGFYSFGGVFVESILQFSPTLNEGHPLNSEAFDELFGPFSPELGGSPATEGDRDGVRALALEDAVHALGSVIGNTVSHEIGHSLGLTWFEEDAQGAPSTQFHNPTDQPGAIMDSGQDRPFEERAELEGTVTPWFTPGNRAYLEFILPKP